RRDKKHHVHNSALWSSLIPRHHRQRPPVRTHRQPRYTRNPDLSQVRNQPPLLIPPHTPPVYLRPPRHQQNIIPRPHVILGRLQCRCNPPQAVGIGTPVPTQPDARDPPPIVPLLHVTHTASRSRNGMDAP